MKPNQNLRKNVAWATKTASQFDDIFKLALWPEGRHLLEQWGKRNYGHCWDSNLECDEIAEQPVVAIFSPYQQLTT